MNHENKTLVIWDCDGVLVDSEWIGAKAFAEIIRELGGNFTTDQIYHALKGGSIYDSISFVHQNVSGSSNVDIEKLYRQRSIQLFEKELKKVDGVEEVLQRTSIYRCIASNGPKVKIHQNLNIVGLKDYFAEDSIFSGHDIDRFKPLPDLFLLAADKMGCSPENCVVIEDSIFGAQAAQAAGMLCFGYSAETPRDEFKKLGAIPFNSMAELIVNFKEQNLSHLLVP